MEEKKNVVKNIISIYQFSFIYIYIDVILHKLVFSFWNATLHAISKYTIVVNVILMLLM